MHFHSDLLVIGAGIAGLSYTIWLADNNPNIRINLLSKNDLWESNTKYAQGGLAVVSNFSVDSFDKHVYDTLQAGDGLCDKEIVEFVVREGPLRLQELIGWGASFDTNKKQFNLGREGGHSENRIVHAKDKTGFEIQKTLIRKIKKIPNIKVFENYMLVDLITNHHLKKTDKPNHCYGAYVINDTKDKIVKFTAPLTVLASGGAGQIYQHTTNPETATGDGIGAAYRAKVRINNLHFVQFHPTAFYHNIDGKTFLITEAIRGLGAKLISKSGKKFMKKYDSREELASRDIVARAIDRELIITGDDYVLLDCTKIKPAEVLKQFPSIYNTCKKTGIDLLEQPIPVVPAAHYFCGGIQVNEFGESSLNGLLAIGECSNTGLHGANRLASNSLLEAIVFARRAALHTPKILSKINLSSAFFEDIPRWNDQQTVSNEEMAIITYLRQDLRAMMSKLAGIVKSDQRLKLAETKLNELYETIKMLYKQSKLTPQLCELRNLQNVAYLVIQQSISFPENRGVFYNKDYA